MSLAGRTRSCLLSARGNLVSRPRPVKIGTFEVHMHRVILDAFIVKEDCVESARAGNQD